MLQSSFQNIFCFSHLRWDFVFQRPQHLFSRFSKIQDVYFWEEPVFDAASSPFTTSSDKSASLKIIVPHLSAGLSAKQQHEQLEYLLKGYLSQLKMEETVFWYYTPMALTFTQFANPAMVIYDCMDELSAFDFAPTEMAIWEQKLLLRADIVFTGGVSLYEAKKNKHHNIYPFPSSIDKEHFSKARHIKIEPDDQRLIPNPKIGFFGVIDERFDIPLLKEMAEKKPDWQFVLIGPVVKIEPATLPRYKNIHYLGAKSYDQLPAYLSAWDVALISFALNKSTQFISPTKTPEYLSAGIPVVSTAIKDVVYPYGKNKLVHIAKNTEEFIFWIQKELDTKDRGSWRLKVDAFLKSNSWDKTFSAMQKLIEETHANRVQLAS